MLKEHMKDLRRIKEKEHYFHFKALVRNSTKYHILQFTWFLTSTNNNEVQFEFREAMRHARESLHLGNKNMLRTFLGLKLKKLRRSEGFLQF